MSREAVVELEVAGDAGRCVICGEPNDCKLAREQAGGIRATDSPCWCVGRSFPEALLARANRQASSTPDTVGRGTRCICAGCLAAHEAGQAPD